MVRCYPAVMIPTRSVSKGPPANQQRTSSDKHLLQQAFGQHASAAERWLLERCRQPTAAGCRSHSFAFNAESVKQHSLGQRLRDSGDSRPRSSRNESRTLKAFHRLMLAPFQPQSAQSTQRRIAEKLGPSEILIVSHSNRLSPLSFPSVISVHSVVPTAKQRHTASASLRPPRPPKHPALWL